MSNYLSNVLECLQSSATYYFTITAAITLSMKLIRIQLPDQQNDSTVKSGKIVCFNSQVQVRYFDNKSVIGTSEEDDVGDLCLISKRKNKRKSKYTYQGKKLTKKEYRRKLFLATEHEIFFHSHFSGVFNKKGFEEDYFEEIFKTHWSLFETLKTNFDRMTEIFDEASRAADGLADDFNIIGCHSFPGSTNIPKEEYDTDNEGLHSGNYPKNVITCPNRDFGSSNNNGSRPTRRVLQPTNTSTPDDELDPPVRYIVPFKTKKRRRVL